MSILGSHHGIDCEGLQIWLQQMDIEKFTRKNKRSAERNDSGRGRANRRAIYQPAIRRSGPKRSDNRKITIEELSGNADDAFLAYQAYLETKSETPRIELGWDPNLSEFEQKVGRATLEGLQRVREDREIRDDNSEPNPESLRSSRGKARFIYAPTPGFHVEPESVVYTIPTSPSKKKKIPESVPSHVPTPGVPPSALSIISSEKSESSSQKTRRNSAPKELVDLTASTTKSESHPRPTTSESVLSGEVPPPPIERPGQYPSRGPTARASGSTVSTDKAVSMDESQSQY